MKLSIQLALALATALVAIVLAYSELRHGVDDLQAFKTVTSKKLQRLEIRVSHLQSWLDEAKVKR